METLLERLSFFNIQANKIVTIISNNECISLMRNELSENLLKERVLNDALINGELIVEIC